MYDLEKIKDVAIEDVAVKLGMRVVRHTALCPFHADKVASLHFHKDRRHWKCFACEKGGDQIALVMEYLGFCFTRACEWIEKEMVGAECHSLTCDGYTVRSNVAKVAEVDLQYLEWVVEKPQLTDAARRFLFGERMISEEVIGRLGITSIDKPLPCTRWGNNFFAPGLLIPYRDRQNRLLTVQGRALNRTDESQPRFRFPSGSHCPVYNLPVLEELGEGEELWIAEGCSDCWALLSSGKKAIAIPSASLLMDSDIEPLKKLNLHMSPDNDAAGSRLFSQIKALLPQTVLHRLPDGIKDFCELWVLKMTS